MHFRSQKEKNKRRNTRTSNRTCVSGPGVPVRVEMRVGGRWWLKHVSGVPVGIEMHCWGVIGSQNLCLGVETRRWRVETGGWGV